MRHIVAGLVSMTGLTRMTSSLDMLMSIRSIMSIMVLTSIMSIMAGPGSAASRADGTVGPERVFRDAVAKLFAGEPEEASRLFDEVVASRPEDEPQFWQRGIALYYAGRFADGRRQFEVHRTVNPADVENVTWHFACVARGVDAAAAREALLPVGEDPRVPMREILALYAGRGDADAVLAAADAGPESARRNQRCYAHLYLGLHAESRGDAEAARLHMLQAAGPFAMGHFMGRIAQLHVRLRGWEPDAGTATDAATR